jgi:hypothetical protein
MRRTAWPAGLNTLALVGWLALTVYVAGDIASRIPTAMSAVVADALPWLVLGLITVHVAAVGQAWIAQRRLRPVTMEKRGAALFSALLLPPQALRLRAILGDGFFPPQHPLAAVLAFGGWPARKEYAFNALADLRWPIQEPRDPLGVEIAAWFRVRLEERLRVALTNARHYPPGLLMAPLPDSPASRSYCPRCHDQFVDQREVCPHGVRLCPLGRHAKTAERPKA